MTTLVANRRFGDEYRKVIVPTCRATDTEFDAFFAEQLREYLYRHGHAVAHIPDLQLLRQVLRPYQNTNARLGPISGANPVQSV